MKVLGSFACDLVVRRVGWTAIKGNLFDEMLRYKGPGLLIYAGCVCRTVVFIYLGFSKTGGT